MGVSEGWIPESIQFPSGWEEWKIDVGKAASNIHYIWYPNCSSTIRGGGGAGFSILQMRTQESDGPKPS